MAVVTKFQATFMANCMQRCMNFIFCSLRRPKMWASFSQATPPQTYYWRPLLFIPFPALAWPKKKSIKNGSSKCLPTCWQMFAVTVGRIWLMTVGSAWLTVDYIYVVAIGKYTRGWVCVNVRYKKWSPNAVREREWLSYSIFRQASIVISIFVPGLINMPIWQVSK